MEEMRVTPEVMIDNPTRIIDCDLVVSGGDSLDIQKEINSTTVVVDLDWELDIETEMSLNLVSYEFDVDLMYRIEGGGGEYPEYRGRYLVIPKSVDQELGTKDKVLKRNVLVKEVPTYEVSNQKGYTFTIL